MKDLSAHLAITRPSLKSVRYYFTGIKTYYAYNVEDICLHHTSIKRAIFSKHRYSMLFVPNITLNVFESREHTSGGRVWPAEIFDASGKVAALWHQKPYVKTSVDDLLIKGQKPSSKYFLVQLLYMFETKSLLIYDVHKDKSFNENDLDFVGNVAFEGA